ncbi:MAG TPA: transglycosylase SLT domain-containing protein [Acidiphilium sp.]|nr:transglycosylase SLT domain-containing protein [Acidiphilium sp.]HQU23182.1 transglycosylase SLT domain-containing protein [Acidiphilium sp.]
MLARPLAPSDVVLYRRIFADQHAGRMAQAAALESRLQSHVLMGQVEAQKYLGAHHVSTPAQLAAWLTRYNGQPDTRRIRALLVSRLPRGAALPPAALVSDVPTPPLVASGSTGAVRASSNAQAIEARTLFSRADYVSAYRIAHGQMVATGENSWLADFVAGLSAWQMHNLAGALPCFVAAAEAAHGTKGEHAAGAFWAARTALRLRQPTTYLSWLNRAAQSRTSFYGMLAGRLLGQGFDQFGSAGTLSEADVEAVDAQPEGKLAFALIQVGRAQEADAALRALWPSVQRNPAMAHAIARVAGRAGLTDVAIAFNAKAPNTIYSAARLPLPGLQPSGGFQVNPSLMYALARTESGFNTNAISPVGARGLMQLMPETAGSMARLSGVQGSLNDPAVSLALGQTYLQYLGNQHWVDGNLLDVLASYNAGPAAAVAWAARYRHGGDPLIFMESIPNGQTRHFVRQVLAESWIYARELGVTPDSLNALAEGRFPRLTRYQGTTLASR